MKHIMTMIIIITFFLKNKIRKNFDNLKWKQEILFDSSILVFSSKNFGGLHHNILYSSRGKAGNETFERSRDVCCCCDANVEFAKLSTYRLDKSEFLPEQMITSLTSKLLTLYMNDSMTSLTTGKDTTDSALAYKEV